MEYVINHLNREMDKNFPSWRAVKNGELMKLLRDFEKSLIEFSLKKASNNQCKASAMMGMNRNTLRKRMRQYDIDTTKD